MKPMTRTGLAVLAGLLAAGAASSADTQSNKAERSDAGGNPTRSCFFARNISSWAPQDDTTVNLRVNVNDYYQLKLLGPCNDLNWDQAIGLEHRGTSWICDGLDAVIVTSGRSGPRRCPATSVRKLTPEEVAALPKKAKP